MENWPEKEEAKIVIYRLKEPALRYIYEKPQAERNSFKKIMDALEIKYGKGMTEVEALESIMSMKTSY